MVGFRVLGRGSLAGPPPPICCAQASQPVASQHDARRWRSHRPGKVASGTKLSCLGFGYIQGFSAQALLKVANSTCVRLQVAQLQSHLQEQRKLQQEMPPAAAESSLTPITPMGQQVQQQAQQPQRTQLAGLPSNGRSPRTPRRAPPSPQVREIWQPAGSVGAAGAAGAAPTSAELLDLHAQLQVCPGLTCDCWMDHLWFVRLGVAGLCSACRAVPGHCSSPWHLKQHLLDVASGTSQLLNKAPTMACLRHLCATLFVNRCTFVCRLVQAAHEGRARAEDALTEAQRSLQAHHQAAAGVVPPLPAHLPRSSQISEL